jgi:hypothetical protein
MAAQGILTLIVKFRETDKRYILGLVLAYLRLRCGLASFNWTSQMGQ